MTPRKTIIVRHEDRLIRVEDETSPARSNVIASAWGIALLTILTIVAVVAFLVGAPVFYVARYRRNRDARQLLESIRTGTNRKRVILFLRQFNPDRGWTVRAAISRDFAKSGMELVDDDFQRFALDDWVDALSSTDTRVLKVADRVDAQGGSIRLDNTTWKETVGQLIQAADGIAILPGLTEGVLWEVRQIVEANKVDVTKFVMPYGNTPDHGEKDLWDKYRMRYAELGFHFPPYSSDGMLMQFDGNGELSRVMPILGSSDRDLAAFITGDYELRTTGSSKG